MDQVFDWKVFGWFSLVSVLFNRLMAPGCDTWGWSFVIMMITICILLAGLVLAWIPLPEDWFRMIMEDEE